MFSALARSHSVGPEFPILVRIGIATALATILGATGCARGPTKASTAARATAAATAAAKTGPPRAKSAATHATAVPRRITGPRSVDVPRILGASVRLAGVQQVGPGRFAGSTTIPPLPPFVHRSYPVTFVARDARGTSTQSAVGVSVR